MQRLLKDYQELSNIYTVYPIKDSIDNFYIIIKGNDNSPYENIPFIFVFNVTNEYPFKPPNVKYISFTNANIHPNLYTNGKVCLTTLGTYIGPDSSNLNKTCGNWNHTPPESPSYFPENYSRDTVLTALDNS